jgi:VIT1/CCC1 family predicted Fe2+/Mn2+ transporter
MVDMSDREQREAIGRFVEEYAAAKKRLAAMEIERERLQRAFASVANGLATNVSADFNLSAARAEIAKEPLSGFDFGTLILFLEEYASTRKSVESGEARLRELGLR